MERDVTPLTVIWRHKLVVLSTFLAFTGSTVGVSLALPNVYETQSTLLIALPVDAQSFDSVQASQALARSYSDIIDSPNIAELVARRVGGGATRRSIEEASSFEAVLETQLLKITAEAEDAQKAKAIADSYAAVFGDYAKRNLARETKATITVADFAPMPDRPARPQPIIYSLVGAILGLGLGIALAFVAQRLDRRLRTVEEVEQAFPLPVLARVPRRGASQASLAGFREAHRLLHTNLQFALAQTGPKAIAIVSGAKGEGKSSIAAELARAAVDLGARAIAVEADLRRPGLHPELVPDLAPHLSSGLSNYLAGATSLDDAVYPTADSDLYIVPSGSLPPNPARLLESERGRSMVTELKKRCDLVILDCPPVSIGADASIVSQWADGVIVLVDLERTMVGSLRDALRQLETVQARVLGIVVNRDRHSNRGYYDYLPSKRALADAEQGEVLSKR